MLVRLTDVNGKVFVLNSNYMLELYDYDTTSRKVELQKLKTVIATPFEVKSTGSTGYTRSSSGVHCRSGPARTSGSGREPS